MRILTIAAISAALASPAAAAGLPPTPEERELVTAAILYSATAPSRTQIQNIFISPQNRTLGCVIAVGENHVQARRPFISAFRIEPGNVVQITNVGFEASPEEERATLEVCRRMGVRISVQEPTR